MDRHLFELVGPIHPIRNQKYIPKIRPHAQWVLDGGVECEECRAEGRIRITRPIKTDVSCYFCKGTGRLPLAVSRWYADDGMRVKVEDGKPFVWAANVWYEFAYLKAVSRWEHHREAWERLYSTWSRENVTAVPTSDLDGTYSILTHATTEKGDVCGQCGSKGRIIIRDIEVMTCPTCHGHGILPTLKRWGSEAVLFEGVSYWAKKDMPFLLDHLFKAIRMGTEESPGPWSGLAFDSGDQRVVMDGSLLEAGG